MMQNNISIDEVYTAIEVLRAFRDDIRDGEFYGWGLDSIYVATTKSWLENLVRGVYGDRWNDDGADKWE